MQWKTLKISRTRHELRPSKQAAACDTLLPGIFYKIPQAAGGFPVEFPVPSELTVESCRFKKSRKFLGAVAHNERWKRKNGVVGNRPLRQNSCRNTIECLQISPKPFRLLHF